MSKPLPLTLVCHPALNPPSGLCLSADACRSDTGLIVTYRVTAPTAGLCIPSPHPPGPADNLWQTTCCEAFVALAEADGYLEFNLSPSGQWAVYRFDAYRQRDMAYAPRATPMIDITTTPEGFTLNACLPLTLLPAGELAVSLNAVIESTDGNKSYWALTHAGTQPDFHLSQSFTLRLPPVTP